MCLDWIYCNSNWLILRSALCNLLMKYVLYCQRYSRWCQWNFSV